jgi:hypothetical protein
MNCYQTVVKHAETVAKHAEVVTKHVTKHAEVVSKHVSKHASKAANTIGDAGVAAASSVLGDQIQRVSDGMSNVSSKVILRRIGPEGIYTVQ